MKYNVTFCRTGKSYSNRKLKGKFTKEFDSLDDIVKFMDCKLVTLYIVNHNLTKTQLRQLYGKLYSCITRQERIKNTHEVI